MVIYLISTQQAALLPITYEPITCMVRKLIRTTILLSVDYVKSYEKEEKFESQTGIILLKLEKAVGIVARSVSRAGVVAGTGAFAGAGASVRAVAFAVAGASVRAGAGAVAVVGAGVEAGAMAFAKTNKSLQAAIQNDHET